MVFTLPEAEAVVAGTTTSKEAPVDLFRDSERFDPDRKRARRKSADDDWEDDRDRDEPRPRRNKTRRSGGSALPWVLGLGGAAVVLLLFCGGAVAVIALVTLGSRNHPQKPAIVVNNPPMVVNPGPAKPGGNPPVGNPKVPFGQQVQLRQGPGTRIQLANGQFQTTTQLAPNDPVDPDDGRFRCKLYQVDLQAGRSYQIDMTSPNPQLFDPYLRLEDANGGVLAEDDDSGGNLNARILFRPTFNGSYVVVATCYQPGTFGTYTLTIRDTTVGGK
jgi:hypothetical protein